jgi:hypothetical protein
MQFPPHHLAIGLPSHANPCRCHGPSELSSKSNDPPAQTCRGWSIISGSTCWHQLDSPISMLLLLKQHREDRIDMLHSPLATNRAFSAFTPLGHHLDFYETFTMRDGADSITASISVV